MLCGRCRETPAATRRNGRMIPREIDDAEPLARILCSACGEVLPDPDPTDGILEKLVQLSRFGLVGGGSPLLRKW